MPLTRIQPAGLDSTKDFTFNKLTTNTVIVNGVDVSTGGGPKITNVQVTNSSYTVLDDTAVALTGGYIKITGTGFVTGCQVLINNTPATSVSFVSATEVRAQVPATSAGTYVVYLVNPDGGVAIRVNGITFSGNPTWVTDTTLPSGIVDTSISIQLNSSGDAPITYALQAGSSLPTGLTLTSGGLLSGTVTGISVSTTYNFTIEAIDAQSQESPRAFSIAITAGDANFNNNTLLLAGSRNTFIKDSSTNNFNLTVNGDTKPNNFGPYTPGYYSNYFDGSGDYLTTPSAAAFNLAADFTIEAWIYPTVLSLAKQLLTTRASSSTSTTTAWALGLNNAALTWYTNSYNISGGTVVLNAWNHVAAVRSGSTLTLYLNGTSIGTATLSNNFTDQQVAIGACINGTEPYTGYISNVRIVKGTAVYTSNFTPPTAPLTAIANTSLLTCQSNRFIDNSTNNFTITRNGDTTINGFDPFVPSSSYATYGSGYFDGTGDYLQTPSSSAFLVTGSNMTIECWFYATSLPAALKALVTSFNVSNGGSFWMGIDASNKMNVRTGNDASVVSGTTTILPNIWYHMAVVKDGSSSMKGYLNGVLEVSSASFNWTGQTQACWIASYNGSGLFTGYISDARVVNGTAVYTSAFTPPTAPLTAIANTSLLTLQTNQPNNNNMFVDNSTNNFLVTKNGNTTQGSFSPYPGTWSAYFDGTGDTLTLPTNQAPLQPGSGNFTIEFWYYTSLVPNTFYTLFSYGTTGDVLRLFLNATNAFVVYTGTSVSITTASNVHQINKWQHVALVRSGTTLTLYVNGVSVGTSTSNSTNYVGNLTICYEAVNQVYYGYISNFRIVKGTAVYTGAFTTPTDPLIPIANTTLLICNSNRFIDSSGNYTITVAGDSNIQKFSPFNLRTLPTPTSYSVYFDGTGDYLTISSSAIIPSTQSTFTIEGWLYMTANPVAGSNIQPAMFGDMTATSFSVYLSMGPVGSGPYYFGFYWYDGATKSVQGNTTLSLSTWYHLAVSVSNNTIRLFVNGVLQTLTGTTTLTNRSGSMGVYSIGLFNNAGITGYISNLRAINGTALYTDNFTPSTTPLTAVTNTSLLTCQNTTIIDNSTNNFTIAANGNSQPFRQNPFTLTNTSSIAYTAALLGGSMYFDGTNDFLSIPPNSNLAMGTGDFTVEWWYYPLDSGTTRYLLDIYDNNSSGRFLIQQNTDMSIGFYGSSASTRTVSSANALVKNIWNHIAICRSSGTTRIFSNGVQVNTNYSDSGNYTFTSTFLYFGTQNAGGTQNAFGFCSDFRIVKGQALYISPFVPPAAPLTAVSNTTLLLAGTAGGIIDSTMINDYETVGDVRLVDSVVKYGNSSIYFDGTGDYLTSRYIANLEPGSSNLTWEMWINTTSSLQYATLYSRQPGAFTSGMYSLLINSASSTAGDVALWVADYSAGGPLLITTGANIRDGNWHHIAVVRNGSSWVLYVDGTSRATGTWGGAIAALSTAPRIGADQNYGRGFTGYMDDIRITNGNARYTANFTPPTNALSKF